MSRRHFQIFFLENFETERFVKALNCRENILPIFGQDERRATTTKFWLALYLALPLWVRIVDPLAGPLGVVVRRYDLFNIRIHVGTMITEFHLKITPQKNHYKTL